MRLAREDIGYCPEASARLATTLMQDTKNTTTNAARDAGQTIDDQNDAIRARVNEEMPRPRGGFAALAEMRDARETKANARLVASAPTILAQRDALLAALEKVWNELHFGTQNGAKEIARAAIAKEQL